MDEVKKQQVRRYANYALSEGPGGNGDPVPAIHIDAADAISLLDELDRSNAMCAKHGKALQEIGSALSLVAGADLHRECVPKIHGLFLSIGSGVIEAYRERMRCQEVIDQLRAEVEALRKDAERYRWLRRGENYAHQYLIDLGMENLEGFDRSIDAAMSKEGSANG